MTKVFVDMLTTSKKHHIFTGKDALAHALYYAKYKRVADCANKIFRLQVRGIKGMCWGNPTVPIVQCSGNINGSGNHAKIYDTDSYMIFSSQNNTCSPLFEFAILYFKDNKSGRLQEFVDSTFRRCKAFTMWYQKNRSWKV